MVSTAAAPPPEGSAAKDFGRTSTRWGPGPVKVVFTLVVPPKTGSVVTSLSPSSSRSTLLVSTLRSSFTERRPATSRPV